jgi:GNAT superfamily N-acetyltransferase
MSPREIYAAYVSERRAQPIAGYHLEALPHLTRARALGEQVDGFVLFANLPPGKEAALIDEQLAHFADLGPAFEWKVYDFDTPDTLKQLLEQRGFSCEEEEAFLVLPAADWKAPTVRDTGVRIEKITDDRGLRDIVAVQAALYPEHSNGVFARYSPLLRERPYEAAMFCAYLNDQPVGTGWIDFPQGRFADLHGGAVLPAARGRGIFSALVHARLLAAQARGYTYLAVDTTRMSRPILLKKGFQHVCYTYPLRRVTRLK